MEAIGDRLFEIVSHARDNVVMGPMSDPAEARLRAGVTRYFMAVAWISADAELARRKWRGDEPKAVMHDFLQKMHEEARRVQMAIEPFCTDDEIWRMLFDDAGLYSQVLHQAMTQLSGDAQLAAGLCWFEKRSFFDFASAEAYGECIAVLTIGAAIPPQIAAVFDMMRVDWPGRTDFS